MEASVMHSLSALCNTQRHIVFHRVAHEHAYTH